MGGSSLARIWENLGKNGGKKVTFLEASNGADLSILPIFDPLFFRIFSHFRLIFSFFYKKNTKFLIVETHSQNGPLPRGKTLFFLQNFSRFSTFSTAP